MKKLFDLNVLNKDTSKYTLTESFYFDLRQNITLALCESSQFYFIYYIIVKFIVVVMSKRDYVFMERKTEMNPHSHLSPFPQEFAGRLTISRKWHDIPVNIPRPSAFTIFCLYLKSKYVLLVLFSDRMVIFKKCMYYIMCYFRQLSKFKRLQQHFFIKKINEIHLRYCSVVILKDKTKSSYKPH